MRSTWRGRPALAEVFAFDAAAHPQVRSAAGLRDYLPPGIRDRILPGPERYLHPAPTGVYPFGEYLEEARGSAGLPGSDPETFCAHLSRAGIESALLLPLTRGLQHDLDTGNAICAATNRWLAEQWLDRPSRRPRLLGTVRVNPMDPEAAASEIRRWAGREDMVQVGVPLESHRPYGQRNYLPIWTAAAEAGLPVAVMRDGGVGIDLPPTPNGFPRLHIEYKATYPNNFIYHLASLIAEGVFERLPELRFVFADGGHDVCAQMMWRMDMDWPITRTDVPWVRRKPTEYLRPHVRFCASRFEGPSDDARLAEWWEVNDGDGLLIYASHYPHWSAMWPGELLPALPEGQRSRVLAGNSQEFFPRLAALRIR